MRCWAPCCEAKIGYASAPGSSIRRTRQTLWSDQFDARRTDLLQTQDEIVVRLANALDAELVQAEGRRSTQVGAAECQDVHSIPALVVNAWQPKDPKPSCNNPVPVSIRPDFNLHRMLTVADFGYLIFASAPAVVLG
jgi:hypothetical protein